MSFILQFQSIAYHIKVTLCCIPTKNIEQYGTWTSPSARNVHGKHVVTNLHCLHTPPLPAVNVYS